MENLGTIVLTELRLKDSLTSVLNTEIYGIIGRIMDRIRIVIVPQEGGEGRKPEFRVAIGSDTGLSEVGIRAIQRGLGNIEGVGAEDETEFNRCLFCRRKDICRIPKDRRTGLNCP